MEDLLDAFEELCRQGTFEPLEKWIEPVPEGEQSSLVFELLSIEIHHRKRHGKTLPIDHYLTNYPRFAAQIQRVFESQEETRAFSKPRTDAEHIAPMSIGRFEIEGVLGRGGFGIVYRAFDRQLDRSVAIKVPRPEVELDEKGLESYLREARTIAKLDHPHIVPILEVGSVPSFPVYVVSKWIDGIDLAKWLGRHHPNQKTKVRLLMELADALRAAHKQGIVHRDIKPQNILVDVNEKTYLVDFGLALHNEDVGRRLPAGGTPSYMSPEQAKGEGHRVDGRSDLFSLGIVFYEMLTSHLPFPGRTSLELRDQITELDPKPPRQWDETIDRELERICLKLLSKRKSERFASAQDLIDDLLEFQQQSSPGQSRSLRKNAPFDLSSITVSVESETRTNTSIVDTPGTGSGSVALKIVPKGLRSFDANDADFFLELLPGPRNRYGLPDTLAFWKSKVESLNVAETFAVGLVYGPSGCGKSSMVKAGLIPRLSKSIIPVFVESTPDSTESRIHQALLQRIEQDGLRAPTPQSLASLMSEIRRGRIFSSRQKVIIFLDQFEQWLHAHPAISSCELIDGLKQSDGIRLQVIVLVRDDFWMAATRFFRELDIPLVERFNSAAVDLFDRQHAERVLKAFGHAFGKLEQRPSPERQNERQEQKRFLAEAISELCENDKVISVRLSLFAEMMKSRPWTVESLKTVGGTSGLGATFLNECFSASTSPPSYRYHEQAAQKVLRSLLPNPITDIKGHSRTRNDLLEASGYQDRPKDFEELLRILDSELRLITPVEDGDSPNQSSFQLTHDYLVPSLRDWLTRKQQETRKGRAELKLEERALIWNEKKEAKQLPSFMEWIGILRWTERKNWKAVELAVMKNASRYHSARVVATCLAALMVIALGIWVRGLVRTQQMELIAENVTENLKGIDTAQLPAAILQVVDNQKYIGDNLRSAYAASPEDSDARLHLALARLVIGDLDQAELATYFSERFLSLTPKQSVVVRNWLKPHATVLVERFWSVLEEANEPVQRRLMAAAALAELAPTDARWSNEAITTFVAEQIVEDHPMVLADWQNVFRPIGHQFLDPLRRTVLDRSQDDLPRLLATTLACDYGGNDISYLASMAVGADAETFLAIFPYLQRQREASIAAMTGVLDRKLGSEWNDPPLESQWTEPSDELRFAFESSHGMIEDRFAYCQDMPFDQFLEIAEKLRPSGYRPTKVRPYRSGEGKGEVSVLPILRTSAVWTRDGRNWRLETSNDRSSFPNWDVPARDESFAPEDAGAFEAPDGMAHFLVLWSEVEPNEERRLVLDVLQTDLNRSKEELGSELGWISLSVRSDSESNRRYSAVWSRSRRLETEHLAYHHGGELPYAPQIDLSVAKEWTEFDRLADEGEPTMRLNRAFNDQLDDLDFQETKKALAARYLEHEHEPSELYGVARAASLAAEAAKAMDADQYRFFQEEAFRILDRLLAIGFRNGAQLSADADFMVIRSDPRFAQLLNMLMSRGPYSALFAADTAYESKLVPEIPDRPDGHETASPFVDRSQLLPWFGQGYRPIAVAVPEGWSDRVNQVLLHCPLIADDKKEELAKQQAFAAVALLRFDAQDRVWPLLRHQPDQRLRIFFIHLMTELETDPQSILNQMNVESEISTRRSLVLAAGEFARAGMLSSEQQIEVQSRLLGWFRDERDAGLHAACAWTLKQLGAVDQVNDIRSGMAIGKVVGERHWYLTRQGQHSMMIIEPGEFLMGSPITESGRWEGPIGTDEALHRCRIDRRFAMSSHEVTVDQFLAFRENHAYATPYSPTRLHPISTVTWYDAVAYCNWLSEKEGLPRDQWCYDPDQSYSEGMRMLPDMFERTGYRLPTEAEWEYACRAGSVTSWFGGETTDRLEAYAWHATNSQRMASCPVESLKPNDWGLFGILGNMCEWTHSPGFNYLRHVRHAKSFGEVGIIKSRTDRALRGGSFDNPPTQIRAAERVHDYPDNQNDIMGFRISRTLP